MQIDPEELRITPIDDIDASIIYNSREHEKDPDKFFFVSAKNKTLCVTAQSRFSK